MGTETGDSQMHEYTKAVYDYIHTLGEVGDEVPTAIWPYLASRYDLTPTETRRARRSAMDELSRLGLVERINVRGRYVRILG